MFSLTVQMANRPPAELWDTISGMLFLLNAQGIDEGEEGPPEGEHALIAGVEKWRDDADEFAQAIQPGILLPPDRFIVYFMDKGLCEQAWSQIYPLLSHLQPMHSIEVVEEKNYDEIWKASFAPLHCPPFWLVRAPWHTEAQLCKQAGERELVIEPGMAFGTGTHETTRSCLELISQAIPENLEKAQELSLLDFGCGSGILAIAAKLLHVGHVWAVDIDPLAIDATHQNAARNGVAIEATLSTLPFQHSLDLIVANILKNTLIEFAPHFYKWLKPTGKIILSGLLQDQETTILNHFKASHFTLEGRIQKGEWVSLLLHSSP